MTRKHRKVYPVRLPLKHRFRPINYRKLRLTPGGDPRKLSTMESCYTGPIR